MTAEQVIEYALDHSTTPETTTSETYPAGLCAWEAEVLHLVATGLTNAEVAGKLFISSRTVDWHLGSSSRSTYRAYFENPVARTGSSTGVPPLPAS